MKEKMISIIVPIYNTSIFLEKCIDSLLNQSNIDYEILLINDGSTDDSEIICKEYASKYVNKIRYYYKKNGGLSDTRNFGIDKACGKYVLFVDSDDYLENNCLASFLEIFTSKEPDVVSFGYYFDKSNASIKKKNYYSENNIIYSGEDFMLNELNIRNLPIPACFSFYNREFLLRNNLYFEKGILHEDERWSPLVLFKAKRIVLTDYYIYHYIQHDGSITHKKNKVRNSVDLINTCYFLKDYFSKCNNKKLIKLINNRLAMVYMRALTFDNINDIKALVNIDKKFPLENSCKFKDFIKSFIFFLNIKLYVLIYRLFEKE